ncbi:MAG: 2-dehydropantoate 2-reductase [Proteobacteria bacterium]|nr:2-dehydropantoate 2-reductase [Pseudomonadota bacterium]
MARIVVVGAGAVGSFFGGLLAKAGESVTLIGRAAHLKAIGENGLRIDSKPWGREERIHGFELSETIQAVAQAELVLFCVKSTQTAAMAKAMQDLLPANAVVLSMQNGVENPETLQRLLPQARVVPVAVYVALSLAAPGLVRHFGRGELVVGPSSPWLETTADRLREAGIGVTVSNQVMRDLWLKLVVNTAFNAVSAVSQKTYGEMFAEPMVQATVQQLTREVVAVAQAEGYDISMEQGWAAVQAIAQTMAGQRSSTAQDLAAGKLTEIDFLNGTVARRAESHGLSVPVTQALWSMVRLMEGAGRTEKDKA